MTFVTVSDNREQLALLSRLLIALMPGCTVYQIRDPMRAIRCVSDQKVDAVFADAETCANAMDVLRKHKMQAQLCLLCREEIPLPEETAYPQDVLFYPITEQKMRTALIRGNGLDEAESA